MEFASLDDAYGESPAKKKKSKRSKEGFQAYDMPPTDPDRPAVKRMLEIPPINPSDQSDQIDEYLDQSTKFQMKQTVNNSLPSPRMSSRSNTSSVPNFFGAEPFTNPNEDTMAPFNSLINQPNGYMLDSDFTKAFDTSAGFGRSSGGPLPIPELRHRWKPMSSGSTVDTSFTQSKPRNPVAHDTGDYTMIKSKLDSLMARLDDIEHRAAGANPQMEMLSFIMTGLFLMFALDVTVRKSSGMRLVNVR